VPFLYESAQFVTGDRETVEVSEAIEALDFLNLQLDDSPSMLVFILLVEISVRDLENTASK